MIIVHFEQNLTKFEKLFWCPPGITENPSLWRVFVIKEDEKSIPLPAGSPPGISVTIIHFIEA